MNGRFVAAAACLLAASLGGCAASIDGVYRPDCPAFEGDVITLDAGEFVWDRFTDAVEIDSRGNRIDPFPDYPIYGRYSRDGKRLELAANDGRTLEPLHVHRESGSAAYLLTAGEHRRLVDSGRRNPCALARQNRPN